MGLGVAVLASLAAAMDKYENLCYLFTKALIRMWTWYFVASLVHIAKSVYH